MQVILHLGAHRTGTTSFQGYLRDNRAALAAAGVAHWGPDRTRSGLFQGLIRRRDRVTPDIAALGARSCGLIRMELDRLAQSGVRQLIVSEENMIGALRHTLTAQRLYPDAGARLHRFAAAFADHPTRVVMAIRGYAAWWGSALAYAIPVGHPAPGLSQLDRLVDQPRRWRDVLSEVAQVFAQSPLDVWAFEALIAQPARQLGIALGRHSSLPGATAGAWHHRSPCADDLRRVLRDRGEEVARIPPGTDRWQPFAPPHLEALDAAYRQDLDWLRQGAEGIVRYHDMHVRPQAQDAFAPPTAPVYRKGQTRDTSQRGMEITR
ncbi:hypothetical protein [Brevirhabdus sp.]|uniref:hypothetical protein n=1 Tax=Brevirhabdus sp. TaxID=2004514 RepID=UPI0040581866